MLLLLLFCNYFSNNNDDDSMICVHRDAIITRLRVFEARHDASPNQKGTFSFFRRRQIWHIFYTA
jgi:hypothetical protein